jgi:MFS family permease
LSEAVPAPDSAAAPASDAAPAPSLWRNRDYMYVWTGDAISTLGSTLSEIAFPLLVLYSTGSAGQAGLVVAAQSIGNVLTMIWGGALADRVSRKALMFYPRLVQGAALAVVALLAGHGRATIAELAAAAAVSGLASGLARGGVVPALRRIVPAEQVAAASAQSQGRDAGAQLLGGPLGGFLFAVARWMPFLGDALSFLVSALTAALIRTPLGPDRDDGAPQQSMLADVRLGIRYVWNVPFLRFITFWATALNFVGNGFGLTLIFTLRARGVGPTGIGVASSCVLVAMLVSSVFANRIIARVQARLIVVASAWVLAGSLSLVGLATEPWEIVAAAWLTFLVIIPINAVIESYMVRVVPDELMGRVAAVGGFFGSSLGWLGMIAAGLFAQWFGAAHGALVFGGVVAVFAVPPLLTKSLDLLRQPVGEVEPYELPDDGRAEVPA